jgi:DNA adenine methylase Dam
MIRSPFFYVGDKSKLMSQLIELMPTKIDTYFDVFTGGGSAFLNVQAKNILANDLETQLISLHRGLASHAKNPQRLLDELFDLISHYELSCSFKGSAIPEDLRTSFPKTYFAHFNKDAYLKLRADFNADKSDYRKLYLLLIYGFNRMLRFNKSGDFNLPVGNVDFNKNVVQALNAYLSFIASSDVKFDNNDYVKFVEKQKFGVKDFVYFDPPYLITFSEYNKVWNLDRERELYALLDELDKQGVRFGLSNMLEHKGRQNELLETWSRRYKVHEIRSNYISFNDNSIKSGSREIYVTNHG